MSRARISVIMPAYNVAKYVSAAVGSLLAETEVDVDVTVVSDGSTDGTEEVVRGIAAADPRVKLLAEPHRGVAATRNAGLAVAAAPLITFLDADDINTPGRLKRQSDYLAAHPGIMCVVGDLLLVREIGADYQPAPGSPTWQITAISLGAGLFRRELFATFGDFDEAFEFAEDVDFYLRLWEGKVPMHVEKEVATLYRRHDENMTNNQRATARFLMQALQRSMARRRATGQSVTLPPMFTERQRIMGELLARGE